MSWVIIDNQLTNTEFIAMPEKPFVGDSPFTMWRIDPNINNGMPFSPLMPDRPLLGAFANATQLIRVSIPQSVKKIGAEAFRNTQLTSVTIARDCTYHSTSFPDGCIVNFYPD